MRNPTDLMRAILTNDTAQRIINFVSPIYGNSYVGLWIYQSIGTVLGEVCEIAEQLQYETTPVTSEYLLDFWEDHYKIPRDRTLTSDQRRDRILSKILSRPPCSPARLASTVSSVLNGVPVEVQENVAKNMFLVILKGSTNDIAAAMKAVEQMKPAHLIYRMKAEIDAEADLVVSSAITQAESLVLEPDAVFYETVETSLINAPSAVTLAEVHSLELDAVFFETLETGLAPASVLTHAENHTVEVLNK